MEEQMLILFWYYLFETGKYGYQFVTTDGYTVVSANGIK